MNFYMFDFRAWPEEEVVVWTNKLNEFGRPDVLTVSIGIHPSLIGIFPLNYLESYTIYFAQTCF